MVRTAEKVNPHPDLSEIVHAAYSGLAEISGVRKSTQLTKKSRQSTYKLRTLLAKARALIHKNSWSEAATVLKKFNAPSLSLSLAREYLDLCGLLFHSVGKYDLAALVFDKLAQHNPEVATLSNLAACQIEMANYAGALDSAKRSLLITETFEGCLNFAIASHHLGMGQQAWIALERAEGLRPGDRGLSLQKALFLMDDRRFEEAASELSSLILLAGNNTSEILIALARCYRGMGLIAKAAELLSKVPRQVASGKAALLDLAQITADCNQIHESIDIYHRIIEGWGPDPLVFRNMGVLYEQHGETKRAVKSYRKALSLDPSADRVLRYLARLTSEEGEVADLLTSIESRIASIPDNDTRLFDLAHASASLHEKLGNTQKAFGRYKIANDSFAKAYPFDIGKFRAQSELIDQLAEHWLTEVAPNIDSHHENMAPLLIVGMPRSGTTLLEQILTTSHSIESAGETNFWIQSAERLSGERSVSVRLLLTMRQRYLELLGMLSGGGGQGRHFVLDKMPTNFLSAKLILEMFPQSKAIAMERESKAVIWSNFKQAFESPHLNFSCKPEWLLEVIQLKNEISNDLTKSYPDRFTVISYENLVTNTRPQLDEIESFLGLTNGALTLDYHERSQRIKTASSGQARKAIYQDALRGWARFESVVPEDFFVKS